MSRLSRRRVTRVPGGVSPASLNPPCVTAAERWFGTKEINICFRVFSDALIGDLIDGERVNNNNKKRPHNHVAVSVFQRRSAIVVKVARSNWCWLSRVEMVMSWSRIIQ